MINNSERTNGKLLIDDYIQAPIPHYIGRTEVFQIKYKIPTLVFKQHGLVNTIQDTYGYIEKGWKQMCIKTCPKCLKSIILGRDSLSESYTCQGNKSWIRLTNSSLLVIHNFNSKQDYDNHLSSCKRRFIFDHVAEAREPKQQQLMCRMARYSREAQHLDFKLITLDDFKRGERVFYYATEDCIVGYVAYYPVQFQDDNKTVKTYALWDFYVFPNFRRKQIATKLLNVSMYQLDLDLDYFVVNGPITSNSIGCILKYMNERVIFKFGTNYFVKAKDDLLKYLI